MVEKSLQTEAASPQPGEEVKEGDPRDHCRAQMQDIADTSLVSSSAEGRACYKASAFPAVSSARAYLLRDE